MLSKALLATIAVAFQTAYAVQLELELKQEMAAIAESFLSLEADNYHEADDDQAPQFLA